MTKKASIKKIKKSEPAKNLFGSELEPFIQEITLQSFWADEATRPFLIVSCGLGRDSLALLILLSKFGIRPDLIIFADTKSEKQKTYDYIPTLRAWLKSVDFPDLTIVNAKRTRDESLESMCLRLGVFPSLAYRTSHKCSVQWKIEAINKYLKTYQPVIEARRAGRTLVRAIGFEAGEVYRAKRADENAVTVTEDETGCRRTTAFAVSPDEGYISFFPLIEQNIDFDGVLDLIVGENLPIPPKSACFFCPASKPVEIYQLSQEQPYLFFRALVLERIAQRNEIKKHTSIQGLNFGTPWGELECAAPYMDRLNQVIEIFDLDRAIEDGIPNSKNVEWKPKTHRVELFKNAFSTTEQLETFMTTGEIDPRYAPSNNPFLAETNPAQKTLQF